jgi:hypothetical protein
MVWAATITEPDARVSATSVAYRAWQKKDPAAAEQALNSSGLTTEQMETVRKGASPASPVEVR